MIPKTRFAMATSALPVPRSFVGKSSGDSAYNTPYMMLLVKEYAQFHPSNASDVRAVVDAKRNTPVKTEYRTVSETQHELSGLLVPVEIAKEPRRPR